MHRLLSILVGLSVASLAHAQTSGTLLPVDTVSDPGGARAVLTNPGGMGSLRTWEVQAINTQMFDGDGEGTALLFVTPVWGPISIGLGAEVIRPPDGAEALGRVHSGLGLSLRNRFYFGVAWRHTESGADNPIDGLDALDVGMLWRPTRWFSLGAVLRDLNNPSLDGQRVSRRYDLGFTVRPGTDRVLLDAGVSVNEDTEDVDVNTRLAVEPLDGWQIAATATIQPRADAVHLAIGAGMTFHFGPIGVDSGTVMRRPDGGAVSVEGYSVGVRLSGVPHRSLVRRVGKTVVVPLGSAGEVPNPTLFSGGRPTFTHVVRAMDALGNDETVSGVLIRDKRTAFGWAQTEELRGVIASLKARGKRVSVYLDHGELRHLYLYAGADTVVLNPAGGLRLVGLRTSLTYFKSALDTLGIQTQWVRFGKYKTFPEQFERTDASAESREVRNSLLDGLYSQITEAIATGRKMEGAKVRAIMDKGPLVGQETVDNGFVDRLAFWDEMEKVLSKESGGPVRLSPWRRSGVLPEKEWGHKPVVAVIPVVGQIVEGSSRTVFGLGTKMAGSDTIIAALTRAERDRNVVGVVLRVDSPGGSTMASDLIQRKVSQLRKKKPVVVSFGNLAASGGYYIAMGANKVVASDATVTGSIGIFTGKPAFKTLREWLRIGRTTFTRGKFATLFDSDKPWSAEEIALITQKVRHFYDLFLKRVQDGRGMSKDEVVKVAEGRVWLGSQAKERKLVDERGGVLHAIRVVSEMAGVSDPHRVGIRFLPSKTLAERVRSTLGIEIESVLTRLGLRNALALVYPFLVAYEAGEALMLMPYELQFH